MANVLEKSTMLESQMAMNRKQRKWISKLKSDEIQIIERYTTDKANQIAHEYIMSELAGFRRGVLAAMYLKFGDVIDTNDMHQVLMMANELAYRENYLKVWGADWMKKIDDINQLIKNEMDKLWDNDKIKTQNKMLHAIKKDSRFEKVSNKDIVLVFKELKDEKLGMKYENLEDQQKAVSKALDYIFEEEIDELDKKLEDERVEELEEMEEKTVVINETSIAKKESETLKNKFISFAEEREKIEARKREIEEEQKRLVEESGRLKVKEDKLSAAISLLEEIGM